MNEKLRNNSKMQFWNLWSSYAIYYFGKVNLGIVVPALLATFQDLNMYDFGLVSSGFFFAYAIGQFLHGQISERLNPYHYIIMGLVFSGIANFFMGFVGTFFVALLLLETADGFFQSMGWSSIVRANSEIQKGTTLDKSSTILGCSYQIGNSVAWLVSAFAVGAWGWSAGFFVASIFLITRGALLYLTKPEKKFIPKNSVKKQVKKTLSFPIVLSGISLMLLNMVRYGVLSWIPTYFFLTGNFEVANMGQVGLKVFLIPVAGVIGTLIYNKLPFKKDITSVVFLLLMGVSWVLFPMTSGILSTALILAGSAFLYGPHVFLVSTCPTRFKKDKVVASSTGFIDGMGYIGTTLIGIIVPFLVLDTIGGWSNVFLFWSALSFVTSFTVLVTYLKQFRRRQDDDGILHNTTPV